MDASERQAIVFIDDEPTAVWVMKKLLERMAPQHIVYSCTNGSDALDYIAHHPVCCVITDYLMPHMNGLTVTKRIRSQSLTMPVILLTGGRVELVQEAAHAAGCSLVLAKPLHIDALRKAIVPFLGA